MGLRRFLIIEVRPYVANMRVGQADYLSCVAWIGKNFLVPGKTGVENYFAAASGIRPSGTPAEDPSVF